MLKGKTAVVTGASRGIGAAICRLFAENGAALALISSKGAESTLAEVRALGVRAESYVCDVAEPEAVAAAFKRITGDFGGFDILVNNAGVTKDSLIMAMKPEAFDRVIAVNLRGAYLTIKAACPVFLRRRCGKIINISSVAGLAGNPGQANYAASKAGLIGLTKTVARELAARNVCCNAIAPGLIATDMTKELSGAEALLASIPLGRAGTPADVAAAALYLASPMSDYVTGAVLRVDGGMAM